MNEDSPEFKPLPRKNSRRKTTRRQVVGAGTPSTPRRAARARAAAADTSVAPTRTPRRRRGRRKNPFGWLKYVALLLMVGLGGYLIANLTQPPTALVVNGASATDLAEPRISPTPGPSVRQAEPTITPDGSIFSGLPLPRLPAAAPTPSPTPDMPDIAIVAGHWAAESTDGVPAVRDSGAVCPDGLREVDITKSVADQALAILTRRGYRTTLMQEFDPRYKTDNPDFAPRVYLSIHADSCLTGPDYAFASGYKIAHAEPSDNETEDSRLVTCVTRSYDKVAVNYNLNFNANTITRNMTEYHGFRAINPRTPAAIIELGFLGQDRAFLVNRQDEMARSIAIGLDDFLQGKTCLPAGATPPPTETTVP